MKIWTISIIIIGLTIICPNAGYSNSNSPIATTTSSSEFLEFTVSDKNTSSSVTFVKELETCEDFTFGITEEGCSSGFLEFTVSTTTNTNNSHSASIEITFPGNREVVKTGFGGMETMSNTDGNTPIVFTNVLGGSNSGNESTFRTMGCDPIDVTFKFDNCGQVVIPQTLTFLNPVAVADPCNCNDPQNVLNADGSVMLFHDVMTFSGSSGDAISCVTNCPVILDNTGTAQDFGALALSIPASSTTLTHDFWRVPGAYSDTEFTVGGLTAILTAGSCDGTVCNNNIPTMGEWGLVVLSLLLLIFGLVALNVNQREKVLSHQ